MPHDVRDRQAMLDVIDRADVDECLSDNEAFFAQTLPGRGEPLGSPGGAVKSEPFGVDTQLVASLPRAQETRVE
jgi:hypothetical protein